MGRATILASLAIAALTSGCVVTTMPGRYYSDPAPYYRYPAYVRPAPVYVPPTRVIVIEQPPANHRHRHHRDDERHYGDRHWR